VLCHGEFLEFDATGGAQHSPVLNQTESTWPDFFRLPPPVYNGGRPFRELSRQE